MTLLHSRAQILGAVIVAMALAWGSGMLASALPHTQPLPAHVQSSRLVDYATDAVLPGSRFATRPGYDQ
jgi:hypothetical protein